MYKAAFIRYDGQKERDLAGDYSKHFLMTCDDVKDYVVQKLRYFEKGAELECAEIGDGNINYVFKVTDKKTGKSLAVKQADTKLRSSGRKLDVKRSKIEAEILAVQNTLVPAMVPKVYHYDEAMCALCMEDISAYKNLRTEMLKGKTFPAFADRISTFLADTLLPTADVAANTAADRALKKERVRLFTNIELCDITEDLVLTEPYDDYKERNVITKGNEEFVEKHLYRNEKLKAEVGMLRNAFMNNAQALIHGDLHSGSIFINKNGIKVIDPEFAFYGPIGYDMGNVIGNMFFALAYAVFAKPERTEFIAWAERTIADIADGSAQKLSEKYDAIVHAPLYNGLFKERYLAQVASDSIGFAGTEIIRRVVGDAKVAELTSVTDMSVKIPMERALIATGEKLIMSRAKKHTGSDLVRMFYRAAAVHKIR